MEARQRTRLFLSAAALAILALEPVLASDACSTLAIVTQADVSVSDGTSFRTESFFHSRDAAAIRHIREQTQTIVAEGPTSWYRVDEVERTGDDFHALFALGHQYHALLLHFEDIASDVRQSDGIVFDGRKRQGRSGRFPYGGAVHLVDGDIADRPLGLRFEFGGQDPIEVSFDAWTEQDGRDLPFRATIDDGERIFEYRYTSIATSPRSPLWFFTATGSTAVDAVEVYRLHRTLLAAHCLGDAGLLAHRSTDQVRSANRGELITVSQQDLRERFTALFERLDYTQYHDVETPVVEVAESGDLGWIAVSVRALGKDKASGTEFDDQWAWIMTARKVDGAWRHSGNASNLRD